jgi:ABC-type glycerol-3-phosphate transport system substrate-binding protein
LPGVLNRWDRDGRVYSVPFAHAVWAIFYNKGNVRRAWLEIPRTWDEFFKLCEKIRAAGDRAAHAARRVHALWRRLSARGLFQPGRAEGYRAYNELAPGTRSDPRFVRAAAVLQRVSVNYLLQRLGGHDAHRRRTGFSRWKCAMTVAGSWLGSEVRGKIPPGFSIGAMNFPVFPDGITHPDTLQVQSSYYFPFCQGRSRAGTGDGGFFPLPDLARTGSRAFAHQQDATSAV